MPRRQQPIDGLDVIGARRLGLANLAAGKTDTQLVADRIRFDPSEVEDAGEMRDRLADRLALVAGGVQSRDRISDLPRREGVDRTLRLERAGDQVERRADVHPRRLGDVDPGCAIRLRGILERRCSDRLAVERRQIGDAHRGELAVEPAASLDRLGARAETAPIALRALAPAEAVANEIALSAASRHAGDNPATRHDSPPHGRVGCS
jgi:hypothetical protein